MIHHVTLEIPKMCKDKELAFWKALGYDRLQRTRSMAKTEWLKNKVGGDHIHLYPIDVSLARFETEMVSDLGHVAIVPPNLLQTLYELEMLPFATRAEEGSQYWGARRVFVFSPSGHRVELMEYAPPAKWPAAPDGD